MLPAFDPYTSYAVNHSAPSGPVVIPNGVVFCTGYSETTPSVVIRPNTLQAVNQSAPSGPGPMLLRKKIPGTVNNVGTPEDVMLPTYSATMLNHSAPSGPNVIDRKSVV